MRLNIFLSSLQRSRKDLSKKIIEYVLKTLFYQNFPTFCAILIELVEIELLCIFLSKHQILYHVNKILKCYACMTLNLFLSSLQNSRKGLSNKIIEYVLKTLIYQIFQLFLVILSMLTCQCKLN